MTNQSRPRGLLHIALVSAAALAFVTGAAGCSSSDPDVQETVQCVDATDTIVPDDYCDDDDHAHHGGGGYAFVFFNGGTRYPPGYHVPSGSYSRPKVGYKDSAGRSSAGLSPSGKAQTGQRSVGSAGIGKGSTGGDSGGS